jgi:thiol-disulfide isomerase/thioredoxin
MDVRRPRLLAASLAVAVVVSIVGGVIWANTIGDDDSESGGDPAAIETNDDVVGTPLPEATVSDSDGNPVSVSSFVGDPLVVNFWFSTCPPCAKELPDFAAVHDERGDDVRFIGVNPIDSIEVMERFAGERGVTYELYRDDLAEFTDGIGATNFPITIFVTSGGQIVDQAGVLDADQLRQKIDELQALEASA